MEFSLPGAVSAEASVSRRGSVGSVGKAHGLHAKVWEHIAGLWRVTHNFKMGLELDSSRPNSRNVPGRPGAHLPSISVPALMQLRSALGQPKALYLAQPPGVGERPLLEEDEEEQKDHFDILIEQVGDALTDGSRKDLRDLLDQRGEETGLRFGATQSTKLEDLVKEEGQSADLMDISICALQGFNRPVRVALARHAGMDRHHSNMRWEALVLCPAGDEKKSRFACDIGRALAATFMDELFLQQVEYAPWENPESVIEAFDHYLSTMTLVPTVHVRPAADSPSGSSLDKSLDILLSDSLVDGMEKRIFKAPTDRRDSTGVPVCSSPPKSEGNWVHYFVEVDQLCEPAQKWQVTRRLRQGLELELNSDDTRPHLPHVSLAGLTRVRELMGPNSVALDVDTPDVHSAVQVAVERLGSVGLPQLACERISEALLQRALHGATCGSTPSPEVGRVVSKATAELITPCAGEEACVILSMAHSQVPVGSGVLGAFLRLGSPLDLSCAATSTPTRFLLVLVGPSGSNCELQTISDSLAALAVDEDLMSNLVSVNNVSAFTGALEDRLDALIVMPHAHLSHKQHQARHKAADAADKEDHGHAVRESMTADQPPWRKKLRYVVGRLQKYSVPLVSGVIIALIWMNANETLYHDMSHGLWFEGELFGDVVPISLHFIVNDIFMCFFFGLAIKEVTEAVLPGGSLSPISRAANPLMATVGGILGPIAAYVILVSVINAAGGFDGLMCAPTAPADDGHHRLLAAAAAAAPSGPMEVCATSTLIKGWGVPIATDISLAWMFALLIFGAGHPAINFLLLLAIVDDAIGMAIIAIFYQNPAKPVEPLWLLLVLVAMIVAGLLRILLTRINMQFWSIYVFVCGPLSWLGLYRAHVHPALALVFVVPFMPATHARLKHSKTDRNLGAVNPAPAREMVSGVVEAMAVKRRSTVIIDKVVQTLKSLEEAPLHTFEHHLKLPVDFGMFFFGLANAGVSFTEFGHITLSVFIALLVGKTLGIAFFALFAKAIGFKLPTGVTVGDLFAIGALGGIGLTVALFMSNQAFTDLGLQSQAKIGAVLSVSSALLAWCLRRFFMMFSWNNVSKHVEDDDEDDDFVVVDVDAVWMDDAMVEDIVEVLRMQRWYTSRGTDMPLEAVARSVSKDVLRRDVRRPTR